MTHKDYLIFKISRMYSEVVCIQRREKELWFGERFLQIFKEDGFTLHHEKEKGANSSWPITMHLGL